MAPDVLGLIDSKLGLFALVIVALPAVFGLSGGVLLGLIEIYPEEKSGFIVTFIVRQRGSRRYDLPYEFPLTDSQGICVILDRRRLPDRRKTKHNLDDLRAILSKMSN
jgi:hypothetical protein